jgi:hypothetical protein
MKIVGKPEDRCPYPAGTRVVYWHWPTVNGPGIPVYRGVVEAITEETVKESHPGLPDPEIGELVIRIDREEDKPIPIAYDQFLVAPVVANEPQRWYAEGDDPNK